MALKSDYSPIRLMPHQEEGVTFLLEKRAGLLAFEQGLGKSLIAIAAFLHLRAQNQAQVMLVICPNSLKSTWVAEVDKFAPHLGTEIIEGSAKQRRETLARAEAPIIIVSYEGARAEIAGLLALLSKRPTVLVLDESHAVKNRFSLTSIAAQHFAPRCEYRWLLSGTPVPNTAADLYAQINIVAAGRPLGTFESFMTSSAESRELGKLRARIAPFILRRTKHGCLHLPGKEFVDLRIVLPDWQRRLYDTMRDELICEIMTMTGEAFRAYAPTALVRLLRLSQLASNPALLLPTEPRVPAKFQELDRLVKDLVLALNEKVIIWTHYVETLEALLERYNDLRPVALYGKTPTVERHSLTARFQNDPTVKLLIGIPAAGGSGFTLTSARYAIYETFSWRYDHYAQSQDRIHRIGQNRPVTYIRLIAADTIEEVIMLALERKSRLACAILGDPGGATAITALSPQEFCRMLTENRLPPRFEG